MPTAEEMARGNEITIKSMEIPRAWVPQWRRLDDPTERIVGGVGIYGHCGNLGYSYPPAASRWVWDSGMLGEMGGFAAWQQTWQARLPPTLPTPPTPPTLQVSLHPTSNLRSPHHKGTSSHKPCQSTRPIDL